MSDFGNAAPGLTLFTYRDAVAYRLPLRQHVITADRRSLITSHGAVHREARGTSPSPRSTARHAAFTRSGPVGCGHRTTHPCHPGRVVGPLTIWQTPNGPLLVEHLAGRDAAGHLLVFWWSPAHDWQVVDVTAITGRTIAGPLTRWQTTNGPYNVEHLAAADAAGPSPGVLLVAGS